MIKHLARIVLVFVTAFSMSCASANDNDTKKHNVNPKIVQNNLKNPLEVLVPQKEIGADSGFTDVVAEMDLPLVLFAGSTGVNFARRANDQGYHQRVEYKNFAVFVYGTSEAIDVGTGRQISDVYKTPGDLLLQLRSVDLNTVEEEENVVLETLSINLNIKNTAISYLIEVTCQEEGTDCGLSNELAKEIIPLLYRVKY
jgi:hypothetical protein